MNESHTVDSPRASGMGTGSFASPDDIPDSGLRYAVALPFYQKHGIYVENAGRTIEVKGGAHELKVEEVRSTTQTIPVGGGGDDDWRSTLKSVVGITVKTAENALREKYPILPDGAISGLLGFGASSADSVGKKETISFGVSDTVKIVPLIGKAILARPVYFKIKSVSDEWVKQRAGTLRLVRGSVVSDVVVKTGWILECPTAGGGMRLARQMPSQPRAGVEYDFQADTMLNVPTPILPEVEECAPPTGPPDRMATREGESGVRWHFSGPQESRVESLGSGLRKESGWPWDRTWNTGISVRCPPPRYQGDSRTYGCYRVRYRVEATSPHVGNWDWGTRSQGTVSFTRGMRTIREDESDPRTMAQHNGIPADGSEYEYELQFDASLEPVLARPKVHVDIIPVR
ncbi:hypothetical protein GCM10023347_09060 [Streptomyces chumphonensis]|uniref:Uncharacterized protein n=1 Tax=Streptomyces chumphonensis TaxID=1214925 RepID=A0A927F4M2_9ACTN|nr:hypothetical protein [Streptomyces chumphonensis]MBD3934084.1 hypothetical protein [Streptomyces chumphonensis]